MNDKISIFFEQLKLDNNTKERLKDLKLENVLVSDKNNTWQFNLLASDTIDVEDYYLLIKKCREEFTNIKDVTIKLAVKNPNIDKVYDYYNKVLNILDEKMVASIYKESLVIEDNNLFIEVENKVSLSKVKDDIIPFVSEWFLNAGYSFNFDVRINNEKRESVKKAILNEINKTQSIKIEVKEEIKKEEPIKKRAIKSVSESTILGRDINNDVIKISSLISEDGNITVEGYIFGTEYFESSKSNFKIITVKLTDYTDSIYIKVFCNEDSEYTRLIKELKQGSWIKVNGYTTVDKYSNNELVLNARNIMKIDSKKEDVVDLSNKKRVELHTHTKMSQMDGVVDEVLMMKTAIKWGHKAMAITDHNSCQSFPHLYSELKKYNKDKSDEEKFKVLFGAELQLIDDSVDIVTNADDRELLSSTYVVFDFETTGFNAGGKDQIIEVGAVKIKNGEIIDRFHSLIDPKQKLSAKITEITNITNEMLYGKPSEEEVIKKFKEWFMDLPMVAHNAKFDVSFLKMAFYKYNLGEFNNIVIDTLELARVLDTAYQRHNLTALVKRYGVNWDEEAHHRADYDAEGTALVFHKMLEKLYDRNYEKLSDLERLVSKDDIHKFGRMYHINVIAKNKKGLSNLFKLISFSNTKYLYKTPRILRSVIEEYREGLLIGSGCYLSEVFIEGRRKTGEELANIINFYDYVEVQPLECYNHLLQTSEISNKMELENHIKKIIEATKNSNKIIVATGDVHHLFREDKIYREILVNQKVPGGGRHPLSHSSIVEIPSNHFRTTDEMLKDFSFLNDDLLIEEIVITNTNKIADMVEFFEVIPDTKGIPFSPRIKDEVNGGYVDTAKVITELVFEKAKDWYGEVLPHNIEDRIATELYGDIVKKIIVEDMKDASDDEIYNRLHKEIVLGFDNIKSLVTNYLKEKNSLDDEEASKMMKKELGGIIGGGFDPIYLISQKLVKHSNDDGYIVGSRGSVGSSFVATMAGITEVNPLPAHYRCKNCKSSFFENEENEAYGKYYSTGIDLPDRECPNCKTMLYKDGHDMPFATFLGFNADKVPDIDLNFSDLNQASAHDYTKVLFGENNVFRAGTIGTVADKTAFGFVKGYSEDKNIDMRVAEIERLAIGCTGVKRTTGQHPGGIVVIPDYKEVFDFTPYQYPADDEDSSWRTTHFDYHAIDECVLKLDILGHSDPTQLRMIQDSTKTNVLDVPLDDKDTMKIFTNTTPLGVTTEEIMCSTGTLGIPEFGTNFTISMVAETKPTTFGELVKISGLSHGTDVWIGNSRDLIINNVVEFKEVIGCRDDIMVYLIYNGVEPRKAFKIMEFVRKGRPSKEPEAWEELVKIMKEKNIPEWYINSCQKIKYMFPKAHAVAYVTSAFRIAWYKVHMPVHFYASWFSTKAVDVDINTMIKGYESIKDKVEILQDKAFEVTNKEAAQLESLKLALEASARKIKFLNIDLYNSEASTYKIKSDTEIYPPFSAIEGLGETVAKKIVEERKIREFISIEDLQKRAKVSQTLIDKMRIMGILDGMSESSQLTLF